MTLRELIDLLERIEAEAGEDAEIVLEENDGMFCMAVEQKAKVN